MDNEDAAFALREIGEFELAGEADNDWEAAAIAAQAAGDHHATATARLRAGGLDPAAARFLAGLDLALDEHEGRGP